MSTHGRPDRSPAASGATVEQLLARVPPGVLEVVAAPAGLGAQVTEVTLHDPGEEPVPGAEGLVLLAIGADTASPAAADVVRGAGRAGAAAVVLRQGHGGPDPGLLAAAGETGVVVLGRHRAGQGWTETLGQLRTALAAGGASGPVAVDGLRLGDLAGLANALADLVGGAITVEDPQSQVLAYSRMVHEPDAMRRLTILGQQVPRWRVAELRESGFLQELWHSGDVLRLPADDRFAERLAIAVRLGSEVLGSLWAAGDGRPLPDGAVAALRTAARAAVPHLAHHQTWGRAAARARDAAVRAVLDGAPHAARSAHEAGIEPDRPYRVLAIEAYDERAFGERVFGEQSLGEGGGFPGPAGAIEQRVLDVLALQAAADRSGSVTARSGRRLHVLVPGGLDDGGLGRRLVETARTVPHSVVFAGVGPTAPDLSSLPASREEAELVVRVLRERAEGDGAGPLESAWADSSEVAAETVALRMLDRLEPLWEALTGPVHALVEHDRTHGSGYGASVAAYLDAFGDARRAAERLGVHPNTLRYRLRRARELFGVDLSDPTMRLLAAIGLRLVRRP
ncbi:PucR family transcriptional regulator [Streptomyces triticagri]|uniref:PucR family transcriptional regulator n=1 Tax=Streptomyces triticagri TaxID=2293568 RepID=A0A372MAF0_9ACTN|nr:helix-turn-helix domain-containing protein [Streptomyces triticagri]RFU87570.1 PucR family transcriptional regulator [Streptomyces triticagri]